MAEYEETFIVMGNDPEKESVIKTLMEKLGYIHSEATLHSTEALYNRIHNANKIIVVGKVAESYMNILKYVDHVDEKVVWL